MPAESKLPFDSRATTDNVDSKCEATPGIIPLHKLQPAKEELKDKPLVILVSCGSFSPITNMHLRLFEDARNHLTINTKQVDIIGGFTSPVHDAYGKKSLVPQCHRLNMVDSALVDHEWISNSHWETHQDGWTRTYLVLKYYREYVNKHVSSQYGGRPIAVKLLCGADILESFLKPGVWAPSDMEAILSDGLCVMERAGLDLESLINNNPLLANHKSTIFSFQPAVVNNISSTLIRKSLAGGLSVKYLCPDPVAAYAISQGFYGVKQDAPRLCASNCRSRNCNAQKAMPPPRRFPRRLAFGLTAVAALCSWVYVTRKAKSL